MNYIIEFNPYINNDIDLSYLETIEKKIQNKISLTTKETNDFLSTIIYLARYKINPNLDNYDNKCDLAQSILYYYFNNLGCNIHPLTTQNTIVSNIIGHSFLTLELKVNDKIQTYLIDPTYIQFFRKEKCNKDNYYISPKHPDYILLTPDPGYFIKEEMKENASFLLTYGYIPLTEVTAQMYGDSFYNTKTGTNPINLKYQTIPGYVYINAFTKGNEQLSKTEEELINKNLSIIPFQEITSKEKKR